MNKGHMMIVIKSLTLHEKRIRVVDTLNSNTETFSDQFHGLAQALVLEKTGPAHRPLINVRDWENKTFH